MTVFAPRRTARRPKMVIVRCCGWRSKPAVGSRRAMPICFHRRRCRSITGWSLSSLPPAPPRRSARATSAGAGFSARGKPPLQTGDAVAQRRGADRHQPSAAQLGRPFLSTPRGIALRDGAAGRAQRVACRPRPRAGVCHPAGRRRAERNADPGDLRPDGSLIYLIDAGEAIYERDFHLRDGVTVREDYLGIDHLALGMEADSRDNWVMFFRTVFGFSLEHEQTLPDPYGLVRSPAVRSPQGDIRLALNISQSRATQIARSVACYRGRGCSMPPLPAAICRPPATSLPRLPAIRCRSRPIIMTICWRALAESWTSGSFSASSSSMTAIRRGRFPASLHPALYRRPLFL